jgi:hypothetical protein
MGWVVKAMARPFYFREIEPVPFVQKAEGDTGPVSTGAENFSIRTRSPDRRASNESLYRLSYRGSLLRKLYVSVFILFIFHIFFECLHTLHMKVALKQKNVC